VKNKPSEPGLYWARSRGYRWWNLIVRVGGEPPYLSIVAIRDSVDLQPENADKIYTFGDEIKPPEVERDPDEKTLY
jgi:hypothetical protein